MSDRSEVWLWERATRHLVPAELIDGLDRNDIVRAATSWKPFIEARVQDLIRQGVPRHQWPQHAHWDWDLRYYEMTPEQAQAFSIRGPV